MHLLNICAKLSRHIISRNHTRGFSGQTHHLSQCYKMVQFLSLSLLAGLSAVASAIPTIEVKGSKFFTSEGNQFFVKGTNASS